MTVLIDVSVKTELLWHMPYMQAFAIGSRDRGCLDIRRRLQQAHARFLANPNRAVLPASFASAVKPAGSSAAANSRVGSAAKTPRLDPAEEAALGAEMDRLAAEAAAWEGLAAEAKKHWEEVPVAPLDPADRGP